MEHRHPPVILLAAGNSSRLGRPKQLLPVGTETLLARALRVAESLSPEKVFLVLGASAGKILPGLAGSAVHLIINENWQEGIASSIRAGLGAVLSADNAAAEVIIMVCDQPYLVAGHLELLAREAARYNNGIIASAYNGIAGTPVLFKRRYFDDLLNLQGDSGARKLFGKKAGDLHTVAFKNGEIDIDTEQDYGKLRENDH